MRFLSDLAKVLFRPRKVMARILEEGPRAIHVWLLFALAVISGSVGDLDLPMLQRIARQSQGMPFVLFIASALAALIVLFPVLCWLYVYVPYFIGRFLGGTGDVRGVRASVAWGLAPAIWALVYRIPAAIWLAPSSPGSVRMRDANVSFDPGHLAGGCGIALVLALVEFLVVVGCTVVMSNTLAEGHRFSAWRAFGTLVLSSLAPFVMVLAAVLAYW